jgi:hypothetical protein
VKRKIPLEAFEFYVALGPTRSYQKVADHYGVTKRAITRHATDERWADRLAEAEQKAREESQEKAVEVLAEMDDRHLKVAKALQGKALAALREMPLDKAGDIIKALELGVKQERLIRGEPSERREMTVEEVTKREMQRWLVIGDGDGAERGRDGLGGDDDPDRDDDGDWECRGDGQPGGRSDAAPAPATRAEADSASRAVRANPE